MVILKKNFMVFLKIEEVIFYVGVDYVWFGMIFVEVV